MRVHLLKPVYKGAIHYRHVSALKQDRNGFREPRHLEFSRRHCAVDVAAYGMVSTQAPV
eukprot:COSAG01_NODE_39220_length_479_cov_1.328947_1_plen_58_part_10